MKKKYHKAIYYGSTQGFIFRCLFVAVILQIVGMSLFVVLPNIESFYSFFSYQLGVIIGVGLSSLMLGFVSGGSRRYIQYVSINEKKILTICFFLSVPLIPDALGTLVYMFEYSDIRKFLLENQDAKIISPKITMFFGVGLFITVSYYLTFVTNKSKFGILLALSFVFLKSLLFMSRAEFVILAIFYMLNRQKLFSFRMVGAGFLIVIFLAFFTVYAQGRTGDQGFDALTRVLAYYSAYFGYPLYLTSNIGEVFGEYSVLYSLIGYPWDVVESFLSSSGVIASHLDHIATPTWVGFDVFGREHYWGNVLYPQYGFIAGKLGDWGVVLYYAFIAMMLSLLGELYKPSTFFWRVLVFIWIFNTARSAALGVPGTWFQIFFSAILAYYLVKKMIEKVYYTSRIES